MNKIIGAPKRTFTCDEIVSGIRAMGNPANVAGMARFGINPDTAARVSMPFIRGKAKEIGKNHKLALEVLGAGLHEAKNLAALVDEPAAVTEKQMEKWVSDFDSWDVCDQVCGNLFDKTRFAYEKVAEWTSRDEEFVKRAGFVLIAMLSVHDKKAADVEFIKFLPIVVSGADDDRNFVKKAVNWALRQIGKRNMALNARAIATAEMIRASDSKSARWVATDALRELTSEKTISLIKK
jgi:3-methyladenine DNA glycosylase AlkD